MKKIENDCKGCMTYTGYHCGIGIIPDLPDTDGCPCRKCLVKGICHHSTCVEFIKYRVMSRQVRSYRQIVDDTVDGIMSWHK